MAAAIDIKLSAGHLVFEGGELLLTYDLEGIAQLIETSLGLIRGEWFADLEAGIPYFEIVWQKNPNLVAVREVYRKGIADVPGVVEVQTLDLRYVGARKLEIRFKALTDAGLLTRTLTLEG